MIRDVNQHFSASFRMSIRSIVSIYPAIPTADNLTCVVNTVGNAVLNIQNHQSDDKPLRTAPSETEQ